MAVGSILWGLIAPVSEYTEFNIYKGVWMLIAAYPLYIIIGKLDDRV